MSNKMNINLIDYTTNITYFLKSGNILSQEEHGWVNSEN